MIKVELFEQYAIINHQFGFYVIDEISVPNFVNVSDSAKVRKYVMFLELVEFYLRELNNE